MFALPTFGAMAARQIPWGKIIVAGIILVLCGACVILYWRMDTALEQAETARKAEKLARDDATRWQAAAEEFAQIILDQNAASEAQRLDLQRANKIIGDAVTAARQASEAADAQIRTWKEKARANPDQVVPLGPIARDAVRVLVGPAD
jgi:hypothetical protein